MPKLEDLGDPGSLPPAMQKQLQDKLADKGITTIPGYNVGGSGRGSGTAPIQPMIGASPVETGPYSEWPRNVPTPPRPGLMLAPGVMKPPPPPGAVAANRARAEAEANGEAEEPSQRGNATVDAIGALFAASQRNVDHWSNMEGRLSGEGMTQVYGRTLMPDRFPIHNRNMHLQGARDQAAVRAHRISPGYDPTIAQADGTSGGGIPPQASGSNLAAAQQLPANMTGAQPAALLHRGGGDPLFQQNNAGVGAAANFWNDSDPQHDAATSGIKNPSVHLR